MLRQPSQVIWTPDQLADIARQNYTKDLSSQAAPASFHDNLLGQFSDWFNTKYGPADSSTLSDADRGLTWKNTFTAAEQAFEPNYWASVDPTFVTGPQDQGWTTPMQGFTQGALGTDLYNSIAGYQPKDNTADITAAYQQKLDKYKGLADQQAGQQDAYNQQIGGGYLGGVVPKVNGAWTLSNPWNPGDPMNGDSGTNWSAWGQNSGGLGGLGGFTPSQQQQPSAWGGPFSNTSSFAPGR